MCAAERWIRPRLGRLWALLIERAAGFAAAREDVLTANLLPPRRGLGRDESSSFLRAVDEGFAVVDRAGYVTLPMVQQKKPVGRYALFSKSGAGVSVNLEYLVQVGATAELVLDHGWSSDRVGFERGEFDAVAYDEEGGRVAMAMEAKARPTGPDSLEKLVRCVGVVRGRPDGRPRQQRWPQVARAGQVGERGSGRGVAGGRPGPVAAHGPDDESGASAHARCDREMPATTGRVPA